MRRWLALAVASCGFSPGHLGQSDGATVDTPRARDAAPMLDAAPAPFALSGMRWVIPCTAALDGTPTGCEVAPTSNAYVTTIALTGSASEHWTVTARVAGAMEGLTYTGGTADGQWYVGGGTGIDIGDNYYEIAVSSPAQHYYLNDGVSGVPYSIAEDYTVQLPIDGDATVVFSASPQDMYEWQGIDSGNQPIAISGFTAPPPNGTLYGQWAYFVVTAATLP